ncbi:hypothetical protein ACFXKF_36340 [Streptomyces scopuliridis]|uniref:hypothetical protein n=1 Tax=Streptomyces scopuliridis TaxID=452529 RepID=UPI0036A3660E
MSHQLPAPPCAESATTQYRADYSDAQSHTPLEPTYDTLAEAQSRCETALRDAREDGDALVISWRPDSAEPVLWDMLVQTPLLRSPVRIGYAVTVVGSVFDSVAAASPKG